MAIWWQFRKTGLVVYRDFEHLIDPISKKIFHIEWFKLKRKQFDGYRKTVPVTKFKYRLRRKRRRRGSLPLVNLAFDKRDYFVPYMHFYNGPVSINKLNNYINIPRIQETLKNNNINCFENIKYREDVFVKGIEYPVIGKGGWNQAGKKLKIFKNADELIEDNNKFLFFNKYIKFDSEYRVLYFKNKIYAILEKFHNNFLDKKYNEDLDTVYISQDISQFANKQPLLIKKIQEAIDILKNIYQDFEVFAIDFGVDFYGKLWFTGISTHIWSPISSIELYQLMHEDFYKTEIHEEFLDRIYQENLHDWLTEFTQKNKQYINKSKYLHEIIKLYKK